MLKFHSLLLAPMMLAAPMALAETVVTELTKVADMPILFSTTDLLERTKNPSSSRSGILQMGDELWFTTYDGGVNKVGSILSYNLTTQSYTLEYSFGLSNPNDPATARMDGVNPWKTTLTLGSDGRVYYAAYSGGATAATGGNGGAIGSFDPNTVGSVGVNVHWSGDTTGTNLRNLAYASPIYVQRAGGAKDIYTLTNSGGTGGWGGIEKISLDAAGNTVSTMVVANFTGPNGRQLQGGAVQVGEKVYFASGSTTGASATLSVLDTTTDAVTVLSTTFRPNTAVNNNGVWSTPIYDEDENALYAVGLKGGILKWDITTGTQSVLANSFDGGAGSNFADPILFGESIYYIKQTGSGQIWRYDMGAESISMIYDLSAYGVTVGSIQAGTFDIVEIDGKEYLYFLASGGGGSNSAGALMQLEITVVPEPGSAFLLAVGGVVLIARRARRS